MNKKLYDIHKYFNNHQFDQRLMNGRMHRCKCGFILWDGCVDLVQSWLNDTAADFHQSYKLSIKESVKLVGYIKSCFILRGIINRKGKKL